MTALLVTLAIVALIALPAYVAGVRVGRGQRRARGAMMPPPRRLPAREVIAEARRTPPRRLHPLFGDTPAGEPFERSDP